MSQVGRRLVEDQQVGLGYEQAGQGEAAALPATEGADLLEDLVAAEEEAGQVGAHLGERDIPCLQQGFEDGDVLGDGVVFLPVVPDFNGGGQVGRAFHRPLLPQDAVEEGGLARAVVAQDGDPCAPLQLDVGDGEKPAGLAVFVVSGGQVLGPEDDVLGAAGGDRRQPDGSVGRRRFEAFHAGEALGPSLGFPRPLPGAVAADELLFLGDVFLLALETFPLPVNLLALQGAVLGIVARKALQALMVQFPDAVDHPVEEVAVVGNDQECFAEMAQEAFQPRQSLEVQVVGGLVKDEQVRLGEQGAGQGGPSAFTAAGGIRRSVQRAGREADSGGHPFQAALVIVAAPGLELVQQGGIVFGGKVIPAVPVAAEEREAGLDLAFQQAQIVEGGHHVVPDGARDFPGEDLGDVAGAKAGMYAKLARVGFGLAGNHPQQGCLARPVGADHPDAGIIGDFQVNPGEDLHVPVGEGQARCRDDVHESGSWNGEMG